MAKSKPIQEWVSLATRLDADETVAKALETLEQANVTFGVVSDPAGGWIATITLRQLRDASKGTSVRTLVSGKPRPIVTEPGIKFDSVVKKLVHRPGFETDLADIVVQEQDKLRGVVPRARIIDRASLIVIRWGADRLEGAPIDVMLYECEICQERKLVAYYDPKNPPKCKAGHLMKPVEE